MKEHMEEIKTYMRGHNLFDIFMEDIKKKRKILLKKYIEIAPRDESVIFLMRRIRLSIFRVRQNKKDIQNETK